MSLSERLRPEVEAAPWVIEEVKRLEEELDAAWMAVDLVKKENTQLREALEEIVNKGPASPGDKKHEIACAALEEK